MIQFNKYRIQEAGTLEGFSIRLALFWFQLFLSEPYGGFYYARTEQATKLGSRQLGLWTDDSAVRVHL